MDTVYLESAIKDHPRTQRILARVKPKRLIECASYQAVFNVKQQNFRLQKEAPALILAAKQGRKVLPAPAGFGIGGSYNFYFSHMLNCIYDCRYCFLQGMYRSANYVLFVNFDDFKEAIRATAARHAQAVFFSGYDCDSLALDNLTDFSREFVELFTELPQATLELRTKSLQVKRLLDCPVSANVVVAFSFTPQVISAAVEHGVPSVGKRIQVMQRLAAAGWRLGLRLDPLIYTPDYGALYPALIEQILAAVPSRAFHSVSLGPLRFPQAMHKHLIKLYPSDPLLAQPLVKRQGQMTYPAEVEAVLQRVVRKTLQQYFTQEQLFSCTPLCEIS